MRSLALAAVLLSAVPVTAAQGGKLAKRPNILVIVADDWSWPHAGVYGDKVARTPNFDKFARQGALFHRAYTAAPTCTPSRAGILTGQAIHRLQEGGNLHGILPQRYAVYPDLLEAAGYVIGLVGKGWGPGVLEGSGRTRNPAGPRSKGFAEFLKALPPDRPFCFWFGSTKPHRPYKAGTGVGAGFDPKAVKVPPWWPDTPAVRSDICDYYLEVERFDAQVGELLKLLADSGRADNTLVIIISDNGMPFPRCKANLYDYGTHEPMAVRWPARFRGPVESNAFIGFTDLAPTILEAAGVKVPADMTGRSFLDQLQDRAAQTTDRDKVFVERERHANVRKGDHSYPSRAVRTADYLYVRNFRPDRWPAGDPELYVAVGPYGDIDDGPTKRAVMKLADGAPAQKRLFELSCGKRPAEELYDLKKDPWEMNNVAADPAYGKVKAGLRAALDKWMTDTGDPRAGAGGGDDRWDRFQYFGQPAKQKKGKKQTLLFPRPESGSRRTALLSRPDGSGEPSYLTTCLAGKILLPLESLAVEEEEAAAPVGKGSHGRFGVTAVSGRLPDLVEQAQRGRSCGGLRRCKEIGVAIHGRRTDRGYRRTPLWGNSGGEPGQAARPRALPRCRTRELRGRAFGDTRA